MKRLRDERGEGKIKVIITLAVIFYAIYVAVKLVPTWTNDKSFRNDVAVHIKYADQKVWSPGDVEFNIRKSADAYDVEFEDEAIEVTKTKKEWRVQIDYTRRVDLIFWEYVKPVKIDERFGSY